MFHFKYILTNRQQYYYKNIWLISWCYFQYVYVWLHICILFDYCTYKNSSFDKIKYAREDCVWAEPKTPSVFRFTGGFEPWPSVHGHPHDFWSQYSFANSSWHPMVERQVLTSEIAGLEILNVFRTLHILVGFFFLSIYVNYSAMLDFHKEKSDGSG